MRINPLVLFSPLFLFSPFSPAFAQQPGLDIQSYHFRIDLPDTGTTIKGLASVFFTTSRGYDDTLRLDLVGMTVRRVFDINTMRTIPQLGMRRVMVSGAELVCRVLKTR